MQEFYTWFSIEEMDSDIVTIREYGHWEKVHSSLEIGQSPRFVRGFFLSKRSVHGKLRTDNIVYQK